MAMITHATVFVDWDTARRVAPTDHRVGRDDVELRAFYALQDVLADLLGSWHPYAAFRVGFRIYHGWHRGRTKSADRLDFERQVLSEPPTRRLGRISFAPEIEFGDVLLCGGRRCCLYDTLRTRRDDGRDAQKMVDTALTSDLLHFARSNRNHLAIVVGDDDDLLPGVFTALEWGAKVIVARLRTFDNQHLVTDGIIYRMRRNE